MCRWKNELTCQLPLASSYSHHYCSFWKLYLWWKVVWPKLDRPDWLLRLCTSGQRTSERKANDVFQVLVTFSYSTITIHQNWNLNIGTWIPVWVINDNSVGSCQVDSKSSYAGSEQENKDTGILSRDRRAIACFSPSQLPLSSSLLSISQSSTFPFYTVIHIPILSSFFPNGLNNKWRP